MRGSPAPRLIAITDTLRAPRAEWLRRLDTLLGAAAPGRVMVQLRDPQLPIRERLRFGRALSELCTGHRQLFAVNDRLDLALLLGASAVHLPSSGVPPKDARDFGRAHGREWLVFAACHDPDALRTSTADGVLLSPVAAPRKGRPALGVAGLERALRRRAERSARSECKVYALGGLTRATAPALLEAGADGVAMIGELLSPEPPGALLAALGIERVRA